jgi:hypothetical protein
MESDEPLPEMAYKIREKIDFEQWVFEQKLEMTRVQSMGDLRTYENMLNSLVNSFHPWWPDDFEAKWEEARKMTHPDPVNEINRKRLEAKEILMATLIDDIGIGFTKKKKMKISQGVPYLWKAFPPFPENKKP